MKGSLGEIFEIEDFSYTDENFNMQIMWNNYKEINFKYVNKWKMAVII